MRHHDLALHGGRVAPQRVSLFFSNEIQPRLVYATLDISYIS
jgi:hypothetical protein